MYIPFKVTEIKADLNTRSIEIYATQEINPKSINNANVQVYEKSSRTFLELDFDISGKRIIATSINTPAPNKEYVIKAENIENILGEKIESSVRRRIVFDGKPLGAVTIRRPFEHEDVNKVLVLWEESAVDGEEKTNSYRLQIASDIAFHNIEIDSLVTLKNGISIDSLKFGQHFVRCRVEKGSDFGIWSKVVTFTSSTNAKLPDSIIENDSMEPEYEEDFEVVHAPKNGITPERFTFEFSKNVDSEDSCVSVRENGVEIESEIKLYDNIADILIEDIKDNSVYEFDLSGVLSEFNKEALYKNKYSVSTKLKPFYSSVYAVKSITEAYEVSEEIISFHIKEASRYVDFILEKEPSEEMMFTAEQFVKYKTAHECILRLYVEKSSVLGTRGKLGDVEFDNKSNFQDIGKLLKYLSGQAGDWESALKGYMNNGHSKPVSAVRGIKSSPNFEKLGLSYSRGV